jgi:hypothetical protein
MDGEIARKQAMPHRNLRYLSMANKNRIFNYYLPLIAISRVTLTPLTTPLLTVANP